MPTSPDERPTHKASVTGEKAIVHISESKVANANSEHPCLHAILYWFSTGRVYPSAIPSQKSLANRTSPQHHPETSFTRLLFPQASASPSFPVPKNCLSARKRHKMFSISSKTYLSGSIRMAFEHLMSSITRIKIPDANGTVLRSCDCLFAIVRNAHTVHPCRVSVEGGQPFLHRKVPNRNSLTWEQCSLCFYCVYKPSYPMKRKHISPRPV